MNREDIIAMGRQAGAMIEAAQEKDLLWLERFAALVASAERNRIWTQEHWTEYEHAIVAQEREACAKVCDDLWEDDGTAYDCAEAIRTLGEA